MKAYSFVFMPLRTTVRIINYLYLGIHVKCVIIVLLINMTYIFHLLSTSIISLATNDTRNLDSPCSGFFMTRGCHDGDGHLAAKLRHEGDSHARKPRRVMCCGWSEDAKEHTRQLGACENLPGSKTNMLVNIGRVPSKEYKVCCASKLYDSDTRDYNCITAFTWGEAYQVCKDQGLRLCNEKEINSSNSLRYGACCGSACGNDNQEVWVSSRPDRLGMSSMGEYGSTPC